MRLIRQFIALSLAILWMPLTMHCGLEAAGLLPLADDPAGACCDENHACNHAGCAVVEDGNYPASTGFLKVPPPSFAEVGGILFPELVVVIPPLGVRLESSPPHQSPVNWTGEWNFVRRAARLPRAPSRNT